MVRSIPGEADQWKRNCSAWAGQFAYPSPPSDEDVALGVWGSSPWFAHAVTTTPVAKIRAAAFLDDLADNVTIGLIVRTKRIANGVAEVAEVIVESTLVLA